MSGIKEIYDLDISWVKGFLTALVLLCIIFVMYLVLNHFVVVKSACFSYLPCMSFISYAELKRRVRILRDDAQYLQADSLIDDYINSLEERNI